VSWLSYSLQSGELEPAQSQAVNITLDSTGLSAGEYTDTLEIVSNDPETPLLVLPITLTVLPGCTPVGGIDFHWTPEAPFANEVITFTARVTGSEPIHVVWDFGDGTTGMGDIVTHSFLPGSYSVTMTASNACGVDETTYTITVTSQSRWVYLPLVSKE
jgi:PKD repeat protein